MVKEKIVENSLFLVVSAVFNRVLKLLLIPFAVSLLGPEKYGVFSYAISLVTLFFIFSDLGTRSLFLKENPFEKNDSSYVNTFITLRLGLLIFLAVLSFLLFIWVQDPMVRSILLIIQGLFIFNKLIQIAHILLQSLQRMHHIAISEMLQASVTTICGILVLLQSPSLYLFSWCYLLGAVLAFVYLFVVTFDLFPKKWVVHGDVLKRMLSDLLPFFITLTASMFLMVSDSLMIKWFYDAAALGIYKSTLKLIEVLTLPAFLFIQAVIPVISGMVFKNNLKQLSKKSLAMIFLYGIPALASMYVVGDDLLLLLYGDAYSQGGGVLKVAGFIICLSPLLMIVNHLLLSHNLYKSSIRISVLATVLNIVLNLIFIPKFWIYGAAVATVIAMTVDFVCSTYLYTKKIGLIELPIRSFVNAGLASLLSIVTLSYVSQDLHVIWSMCLFVGGYSIGLIVLRDRFFHDGVVTVFALIKRRVYRG